MMRFRYEGFDTEGVPSRGVIDASSGQEARRHLRARGVLVTSLASDDEAPAARFRGRARVDSADLEMLTTELSLLLENALRIDRAVEVLARAVDRQALRSLLRGIADRLRAGAQFSEAAADYPETFDPLYRRLVALGEVTGTLPEVFAALAAELSFRRGLRMKIQQALIYPVVVLVVSVCAVLFIFNFVVPNLTGLFEGVESLPWYTETLIGTSDFVSTWQFALPLLFALVFAAIVSVPRQALSQWLADAALAVPGVGTLVVGIARIRFAAAMSMMLRASMPVDEALRHAAGMIPGRRLSREASVAVDRVKRGTNVSEALSATVLFPPYYAALVEVGEEGGDLGRVFEEIASRSRAAFEARLQQFITLLEPALVLLLGITVGSVVIVMVLSITSLSDVSI